jgi:EpsI family protein
MKTWSLILSLGVLIIACLFKEFVGEEKVIELSRPLDEFPKHVASQWFGEDLPVSERGLYFINATDLLWRIYFYRPPPSALDGHVVSEQVTSLEAVFVNIAYYSSQRSGSSYHSPKVCLPGAGWEVDSSKQIVITVGDGKKITVNQVLTKKDQDRMVTVYWYQDRGRSVAGESWATFLTLWDSLTVRRSDGALIRLSAAVTDSVEKTEGDVLRFLQASWPLIVEFMPDASSL